MARLPVSGSDDGVWGGVLNDFLNVAHDSQGNIKAASVTESQLDSAVVTKLNAVGVGSVSSVNGRSGAVTLSKTDVALANVDNTSDASKPVSTATQTALDAKAALSHSHTASQITDSTATGRSLVSAADAAAARTAIGAGTSNLALGTTASTAKAGDYLPTKADVGLGNADNSSDASKPISSATQTALNLKADTATLTAHVNNLTNPHLVTKAQVGLGNVQNQSIIVLGPNDPVPGGTPTGTVIIRTT